jgi:hypothetical protein
MPMESYPPNLDLSKQAVVGHHSRAGQCAAADYQERPGTKKDGQSGEWTCSKLADP